MALDDEIEPVCIYGMDEDVAVDRFMGIAKPSRSNSIVYAAHKCSDFVMPSILGVGIYINAYLSGGNTKLLPWVGGILFAAVTLMYAMVTKQDKDTAKWFTREAERQAEALKTLNM